MAIVAKMECQGAGPSKYDAETEEVYLSPVYAENGPNKQWSQWTPAGHLELTISNPPAQKQIVAGKVYKVTIEPWPEGEE